MVAGTSEILVRDALVDYLGAELGGTASVVYEAPEHPFDLQNDDGDYDAVWTAAGNQTDIELPVSMVPPIWMDEQVEVLVVVQVARQDGADQREVDVRATGLLGDVLAALAKDPTLGIDEPDHIQIHKVVADRWTVSAGLDQSDPPVRGRRYELTVVADARLILGGS